MCEEPVIFNNDSLKNSEELKLLCGKLMVSLPSMSTVSR